VHFTLHKMPCLVYKAISTVANIAVLVLIQYQVIILGNVVVRYLVTT
jgi:hypothetical protein